MIALNGFSMVRIHPKPNVCVCRDLHDSVALNVVLLPVMLLFYCVGRCGALEVRNGGREVMVAGKYRSNLRAAIICLAPDVLPNWI